MVNEYGVIYCSGAKHLENDLSHKILAVENGKFGCGETRVQVHSSPREMEVTIVQAFDHRTNDQLMELVLTVDALKRAGAKKVNVILTIFPYARQERKDDSGTPISARVICDILKSVNINRLVAIDLHATAIQGFMDSSIVFDHISSCAFLAHHISQMIPDIEEWILCSPDGGGIKRTRKLASLLNVHDLCMLDKVRDQPGSVEETNVVIGNVRGRKVLLADDMVDSGGTLNSGIELLYEEGAVEVESVCTHGIFSGKAFENLKNRKVTATNSIDWCEREGIPADFKCLDIRPFIDDIIDRIQNGDSMGSFFHRWP